MKRETICIAYTGENVDNGSMSVNDLAPALISLTHLIGEANRLLNKDDSMVDIKLSSHFERGSFEMSLEIVRSLPDQFIHSLFGSKVSLTEILEALGLFCTISGIAGTSVIHGLINFIRWIKNRRIKKVEKLNNDTVRLTVDTEQREASILTWSLYRNHEIHCHLQGVISPLLKEGVDGFEVRDRHNHQTIERIDESETDYFTVPVSDDTRKELTGRFFCLVKIASINFDRGLKWRFDDGENKFYANIKDDDFLRAVDNGSVSFVKGDKIYAEFEKVQTIVGDDIKSTISLLKVKQILKRDEELLLDFTEPSDTKQ